MHSTVLYSYVTIAVGIALVLLGYVARRRANSYERYLRGAGGVLLVAGFVALFYFVWIVG